MNEEQRSELLAIRAEQGALRDRFGVLEGRLQRLEAEGGTESVVPRQDIAPGAAPVLPPPFPAVAPALVLAKESPREPWSLEAIAADAGWRSRKPAATAAPSVPPPVPSLPSLEAGPSTAAGAAAPPLPPTKGRESLEMVIGTTWLVRAGVVLVLTALAFFGNYLYHNVVPHLGPAAKVALLYLGAGSLTGVGAWLERSRQAREEPRLHTYSQVLFAGGLAAIYYVTYVAHYFERLRVIESPLLAGAMLLAWTAVMVFLAHRGNSELLATVAILLAYYTAAINDGVQAFTLFSNLALTGGVVFLLRRHLWRVFPFASLLATFGSYGFWTYYHSVLGWRDFATPPVHGQHVGGGFWIEAAFLFVYWALFTWAAFTAGEGVLPSLRRTGFVSLNNSAFYLLTTWLVLGEEWGWFWKWSVGFGVVLLVLAEVYRQWARPADPRTEDAYLLQGVLLVTVGFVAYFDGWHLSLVLSLQAVLTLAAAGRRSSATLLACSMASALLTLLWAVGAFHRVGAEGEWLTPLAVGVFLVGAAYLAQRIKDDRTAAGTGVSRSFWNLLDPAPAFYALLGCAVWMWLIGKQAPGTNVEILEFCGAAVVLTASVYGLRVRALTLYAQAFLGAGFLVWASEDLLGSSPTRESNAWTTLGPLLAALALGHWWQRLPGQTGWGRGALSRAVSGLDAILVAATVFVWFVSRHWSSEQTDGIVAAGLSALALVVFGYAIATRYRALAVASQGLLVAGIVCFLQLVSSPWDGSGRVVLLALVPLVAILTMLAAARYFVPAEVPTFAVRVGVPVYEMTAVLLFLLWAEHYLPEKLLMPVLCLAGAVVFGLGVNRQVRRWLRLSSVLTVAGILALLTAGSSDSRASFLVLLGVAMLAGQQQFGKRRLGVNLSWFAARWQATLMTAATLCAWIFVSARAGQWHQSFTMAASWSVFAAVVFTAGLFLRERVYRWLGLIVMAATLGHLVIFDLAQLDSLGKSISFFVLAMVLLGAGFLYSKYQSKFP